MALRARYAHTNLVAADWRRLAEFYQGVFGCEPVPPERDQVVAAGGSAVGKPVSADIPGAGRITFVYATDPEGNIIELQQWAPAGGPAE